MNPDLHQHLKAITGTSSKRDDFVFESESEASDIISDNDFGTSKSILHSSISTNGSFLHGNAILGDSGSSDPFWNKEFGWGGFYDDSDSDEEDIIDKYEIEKQKRPSLKAHLQKNNSGKITDSKRQSAQTKRRDSKAKMLDTGKNEHVSMNKHPKNGSRGNLRSSFHNDHNSSDYMNTPLTPSGSRNSLRLSLKNDSSRESLKKLDLSDHMDAPRTPTSSRHSLRLSLKNESRESLKKLDLSDHKITPSTPTGSRRSLRLSLKNDSSRESLKKLDLSDHKKNTPNTAPGGRRLQRSVSSRMKNESKKFPSMPDIREGLRKTDFENDDYMNTPSTPSTSRRKLQRSSSRSLMRSESGTFPSMPNIRDSFNKTEGENGRGSMHSSTMHSGTMHSVKSLPNKQSSRLNNDESRHSSSSRLSLKAKSDHYLATANGRALSSPSLSHSKQKSSRTLTTLKSRQEMSASVVNGANFSWDGQKSGRRSSGRGSFVGGLSLESPRSSSNLRGPGPSPMRVTGERKLFLAKNGRQSSSRLMESASDVSVPSLNGCPEIPRSKTDEMRRESAGSLVLLKRRHETAPAVLDEDRRDNSSRPLMLSPSRFDNLVKTSHVQNGRGRPKLYNDKPRGNSGLSGSRLDNLMKSSNISRESLQKNGQKIDWESVRKHHRENGYFHQGNNNSQHVSQNKLESIISPMNSSKKGMRPNSLMKKQGGSRSLLKSDSDGALAFKNGRRASIGSPYNQKKSTGSLTAANNARLTKSAHGSSGSMKESGHRRSFRESHQESSREKLRKSITRQESGRSSPNKKKKSSSSSKQSLSKNRQSKSDLLLKSKSDTNLNNMLNEDMRKGSKSPGMLVKKKEDNMRLLRKAVVNTWVEESESLQRSPRPQMNRRAWGSCMELSSSNESPMKKIITIFEDQGSENPDNSDNPEEKSPMGSCRSERSNGSALRTPTSFSKHYKREVSSILEERVNDLMKRSLNSLIYTPKD